MNDLTNLIADPFDPCCSGCGMEWAADDLDYGFCPDCKCTRQDSAFYTFEPSYEVVWSDRENPYYVVRNGEMRIHAIKNGHEVVIRYTDQLEDLGIRTDEQLAEWSAKGEEVFSWDNNSWFEVWNDEEQDHYSDAHHTLNEAISAAKQAKESNV